MKVIDIINKGKELENILEQKKKGYANAGLVGADERIKMRMLDEFRIAFRNYQTFIEQEIKE